MRNASAISGRNTAGSWRSGFELHRTNTSRTFCPGGVQTCLPNQGCRMDEDFSCQTRSFPVKSLTDSRGERRDMTEKDRPDSVQRL